MTQEDKDFLLKDLCARLPYGVKGLALGSRDDTISVLIPVEHPLVKTTTGLVCHLGTGQFKSYLRSMSSMTEEEKRELLYTIVGKDATKYFQVLSDGSIDNTDAAHQDLHNFTMHWINFDGSNTASYIDWLNAHHFDYRGLIPMGLTIRKQSL